MRAEHVRRLRAAGSSIQAAVAIGRTLTGRTALVRPRITGGVTAKARKGTPVSIPPDVPSARAFRSAQFPQINIGFVSRNHLRKLRSFRILRRCSGQASNFGFRVSRRRRTIGFVLQTLFMQYPSTEPALNLVEGTPALRRAIGFVFSLASPQYAIRVKLALFFNLATEITENTEKIANSQFQGPQRSKRPMRIKRKTDFSRIPDFLIT